MQQDSERHKTYYAIVEVEGRRLGTYVQAETVAAGFETATHRYKKRYPLLHVETIAVQEMAQSAAWARERASSEIT